MRSPFIILFILLVTTAAARGATLPSTVARRRAYTITAARFMGPQNAARAALKMPPLKWDARLARFAQRYANRRKRDCALVHSGGPYGENIFWGSGTRWTPAQAAAAWTDEKKSYRYWSNSCAGNAQCGHYTQIVWRRTKRVGCARVVCNGGSGVFMTCNYDPPGNYVGERPY
ncbi:Pathogenesis-related protein PR-1 [Linum grandiflorum]